MHSKVLTVKTSGLSLYCEFSRFHYMYGGMLIKIDMGLWGRIAFSLYAQNLTHHSMAALKLIIFIGTTITARP